MENSLGIVRAAEVALGLAVVLGGIAPLHAQNNSWISTNSGFWQDSANWSAGPPDAAESIFITNGGSFKNIFITSFTSGSYSNTMTVSNLTLGGPDFSGGNLLNFENAGADVPLHILNELDIEAFGTFYITNSSLRVDGLDTVQGDFDLESGSAFVSALKVGTQLEVNGGVLQVFPGILTIDSQSSSNSAHVGVGGGLLIHTNGIIRIGGSGIGLFGQGGGTVTCLGAQLGGPESVMTLGGGSFVASQNLSIGDNSGGYSDVWVNTNGTLIITNSMRNAYVNVASNSVLYLYGGLLQMDNLILTNGGIFTNISGTVICNSPYQVENGSSVVLDGGAITTTNNFTLGTLPGSAGTVLVDDGGSLILTNSVLGIGNDGTLTHGSGSGSVTVSNGTIAATTINLGSSAGGLGFLTLQSNALVTVSSNLDVVSSSLGSTSVVSVTGGSLLVTNGMVRIGSAGSGQMSLSGGSHILNQIKLGSTNGTGAGSLYLLGGHLKILSLISANFVIVDGIDIDGSGGTIIIGDSHDAEWQMMSGMSTNWGTMKVGYSPGYTGTYVQSGGTMTVSNSLIVGGDCADGAGGALGRVTLSGGTLYVTNAAHTAVLDVRNGTFTVNPGATLVVDNLVVTNACGRFMNLGGSLALVQNHPPLLDPYQDADGDGMLNWQEAVAGTDPLNPASVFEMTGIAQTNHNDIRVDWTTVGGHSYVVQTNGNPASGVFHDATAAIPVGGTAEGTTNYVQVGAATNTAGYYRVRLGP